MVSGLPYTEDDPAYTKRWISFSLAASRSFCVARMLLSV